MVGTVLVGVVLVGIFLVNYILLNWIGQRRGHKSGDGLQGCRFLNLGENFVFVVDLENLEK